MTNAKQTEARQPCQRNIEEVPMLVSFATLAGGVFIEVKPGAVEHDGSDRCFRFDNEGNAEYALFKDLAENGDRARWFGHCFKSSDFTFA